MNMSGKVIKSEEEVIKDSVGDHSKIQVEFKVIKEQVMEESMYGFTSRWRVRVEPTPSEIIPANGEYKYELINKMLEAFTIAEEECARRNAKKEKKYFQ